MEVPGGPIEFKSNLSRSSDSPPFCTHTFKLQEKVKPQPGASVQPPPPGGQIRGSGAILGESLLPSDICCSDPLCSDGRTMWMKRKRVRACCHLPSCPSFPESSPTDNVWGGGGMRGFSTFPGIKYEKTLTKTIMSLCLLARARAYW